jgi:diacylglycerol kinase family enzyme
MIVAVIWNPAKVDDGEALLSEVSKRCAEHGGPEPLTFETTPDDPGAGMARNAIDAGAELVIVSGGDGTVAACAGALANSGVAMGLVPAGTGNLLARNLDIPLDRSRALDIAFGDKRRNLDVLEADGHRFVVMAGLGFDAALIRDTDENLKSKLGWLAYLGGAIRALRRTPQTSFEIAIDETPAVRRKGVGVVVGNVGKLQAGLTLLPDAQPDDGEVDVIVLQPRGVLDWLALVRGGLRGKPDAGGQAEIGRGGRVVVKAEPAVPVEFDGDQHGACEELSVHVLPAALVLCCSEKP